MEWGLDVGGVGVGCRWNVGGVGVGCRWSGGWM